MTPTHHTPRGIRRAAAALAGLTPLQWHQLERLTDSGAWLAGHATGPGRQHARGRGRRRACSRLVELGLADGAGSASTDGWRVTNAGHELVMQTRGPERDATAAMCHSIAQAARQHSAARRPGVAAVLT